MKKKINEQTLLFGLPIPFNDEVKLYQPTLKEILEEDLGFEEIIAPFIIMDKKNFDEIYAPLPRKSGVGLALYNRMIRAAAYHIIRM